MWDERFDDWGEADFAHFQALHATIFWRTLWAWGLLGSTLAALASAYIVPSDSWARVAIAALLAAATVLAYFSLQNTRIALRRMSGRNRAVRMPRF